MTDQTTDLLLQSETRALLALILPPDGTARTAHTEALHAMLEPVHAVLVHVQDKLRDVERAVRSARRAETHEQGTGFFNQVANTTRAADANLAAVLQHLDALTATCAQLDRYALEWDASNRTATARIAARAANGAAAAGATVARED